jgi:hypothetical protein
MRRLLTAAWHTEAASDADFFTRKYERHIALGCHPAVAERRVGRYFLKCLLAAWADATRPRGSEPIFDIKHLFDIAALEAVRAKS